MIDDQWLWVRGLKGTAIYAKITHDLFVKQKNVFLLVYNVYNKQRLIAAHFSTWKLKKRMDADYIQNKKCLFLKLANVYFNLVVRNTEI